MLEDIHTIHCCNYCAHNIAPHDQELLRELLHGKQDKQIARERDLPLHIVKYRLRTLYDKMGVMNRTQAALKAREIIL